MTKKKTLLIIIAVALMFSITIAVSYAYWSITRVQETSNKIVAGCLSLNLTGENAINLSSAIPITDEEGSLLEPYTFTVSNTCAEAVNYDVNLESLESTTLLSSSIRVKLDDEMKLYSEYESATKVIESSKESRKIAEGELAGNSSKTYNLRIWIDKDVTISEEGKTFASKIVVVGSPKQTTGGDSGSGEEVVEPPASEIGPGVDTGVPSSEVVHASYAVRRAIDSESSEWERIGYSVGKEANATKDGTEVRNDFDNTYPWSDIKSYNYNTETSEITAWYGEDGFTFAPTDETTEVLTYIPKFYYTRYQTDGYEYILISPKYQTGFSVSEAFSIGRYTMSGSASRVHSRSGINPLVSTTITNFRGYATALGAGFQQLDYHYFLLQLLYLVEYADYNSQAKLGLGNSNNTGALASGGCNSLGMKSGTINNDGKHSVIYRGIEDIYGNVNQFVDGINIKDYQAYINYNPSTYQVDKFDGDYKKIGYVNNNTNGYISKLGYDASNKLISFPIEASGRNETTYITDYYWQSTGNRVALVGGGYGSGFTAGLWIWRCNDASAGYSTNVGARLLKTS